MGFRVSGLGFRLWRGLGKAFLGGIWELGFRFQGLGFRVKFRVSGLGFRV